MLENKQINVLDKGYVVLIDYMGSDSRICDAARVSYGNDDIEYDEDKNRKLIRYMMKHRHTSPFEQVEFVFKIKLPIFVARQMVRHRTASINEISGRYSKLDCDFYHPNENRLKKQSSTNNQGSDSELIYDHTYVHKNIGLDQEYSRIKYGYYLDQGLANEISRINLPLSTYTEWYWKIDLHNLFHFLNLRLDTHAQLEIREYAVAISELIRPIIPLSYEAFEDYILYAETFSKHEMEELLLILRHSLNYNTAIIKDSLSNKLSNRELSDFLRKVGLNEKL